MQTADDNAVAAECRFQVRIESEGANFSGLSSHSLLESMERAGVARQAVGCRGGGCGKCRVRVVSGEIVRGKMSRAHVPLDLEAAGYSLACKTFPRSDLEVVLAPSIPGVKPQ